MDDSGMVPSGDAVVVYLPDCERRPLASILLAMKTYRDWARDRKGITRPELIVPSTAHAAFDKAAQYFGITLIRIPTGPDYRADVAAARRAITRNTIALVGSAPSFPHGVIDPIETK